MVLMSIDMGKRIRQARNELRWTQDQLAERCGVTRSAISQWETGVVTSIDAETLYRCARALGVSMEWLLFDGYQDTDTRTAPYPAVNGDPHHLPLISTWALLTVQQRREIEDLAARYAELNQAILQELTGRKPG